AYTIIAREISLGIWTNQYRDVLIDLKDAREIIATQLAEGTSGDSDETLQNKMAIIDILMGYTYITMVDIFGDIPYSEALDPANFEPVYDDAESIYTSVEGTLSAASTTLTTPANAAASGFGGSDLVYGGDVAAWARFANSVKLRMAMKMADVNAATSVTWATEAMTAGVISSNAENFAMTYQSASPNSSPLHEDLVLSGRADFIAANTIVDIMNGVNDPRRSVYFRENLGAGVFDGGIYGDANAYANFTQVGDILHQPTTAGVLFNYAEIEFLMAEMVERGGYGVTGTAADHYNAGITASFDQWGATIGTYLSETEVDYATATGTWRQKIGTQLWLALYNQGL
ncbi:MAG: SusD/RagB family nutrient-binding outer membrane lipoprotein, partial [Reichenbachiella sp.]|uniref:SusD/RagB family nutrient-binding outer membrane lipoprotein n=1 Tax=Reichenbachiella sp. TaxID=2184521 RepID=UPI0032655F3F